MQCRQFPSLTLPVVLTTTSAGTRSSSSHGLAGFILMRLSCLVFGQDAPPFPVWCVAGWDGVCRAWMMSVLNQGRGLSVCMPSQTQNKARKGH